MRRRSKTLAATLAFAIAAGLVSPAVSQQVASAPLSQVDPWGVGWLAAADGAIPTAFWSNTTGDALAPIFTSIQPKDLSPAARALLRRIVLSRAKAPADSATLTPERVRLMELLGEAAHAADLRKRYAETDWGKSGERLGVEIDLVNGKKDACSRTAGKPAADRSWMPVRALCATLNGDINAANLALEQIAATDEAFGVWLMAATGAMTAPDAKKPEGRYASAFEAAVSVAAKLSVPANAMAAAPADAAAAIVLNPDATLEQKRAALRPALDGGRIKSSDVLAVLTAKDETPSVKPASTRGAPTRPDLLAAALASFATADAKPDARAKAYSDALRSAETSSDARLAAFALADPIKALPKNELTAPQAETFARAALFAGDAKQAADWRMLMATLPAEVADAWAGARIDLLLSYAGATNEKPGAILDRLIAAAPAPAPTEAGKPTPKSATPVDKQLDLRRIENARALFLYAGTGRDLSPAQRALLATQRTAGRGVSDAAIARIVSAADQDADGEAALAIIAQIGADPSAVSFAGLSDLLAQLRRIGLEKDADALALEALQVWKAL
ncbi:MAG: hypothetical protein KBF30_09240 [Hyphomonadaceae bacterium]|nr:hypothetical protein [Hyphomonadaceae bacterium]